MTKYSPESWRYLKHVNRAVSIVANSSNPTSDYSKFEIHNLFVEAAAHAGAKGYTLGLFAGTGSFTLVYLAFYFWGTHR